MKATHKGTCQVCGNEQKLPNGRLSKHGYTVRWNMFQGVCAGEGHLPFEQSKDLIEAAIQRANTERARLDALAGSEQANDDPRRVWVNDYRAPRFRGDGGYYWRLLTDEEVAMTTSYGSLEYFMDGNKKRGISRSTATRESTRKAYVEHVRKQANRFAAYVDWQRERIKNWRPVKLKPVEKNS